MTTHAHNAEEKKLGSSARRASTGAHLRSSLGAPHVATAGESHRTAAMAHMKIAAHLTQKLSGTASKSVSVPTMQRRIQAHLGAADNHRIAALHHEAGQHDLALHASSAANNLSKKSKR